MPPILKLGAFYAKILNILVYSCNFYDDSHLDAHDHYVKMSENQIACLHLRVYSPKAQPRFETDRVSMETCLPPVFGKEMAIFYAN